MLSFNIQNDYNKLRELKKGNLCLLNGRIYVARDAAHKKIEDLYNKNIKIPVSLQNEIIYYMGPTPTKPGNIIGSCGPTSSYRLDKYLELIYKLGVIATIGKGERSSFVKDLIIKYKCPYFITIGGAGAYLASSVTSSKIVMFPELETEAIYELYVKDFPVIMAIDISGNSIFSN